MKKLILGSIVTALLLNSAVGVGASFAAGEQFRNAGIVAYKAKNYKSAVQYLEKALAAGDGSPDCYIYLAGAHLGSGNYEQAVQRYLEASEAFKGLPAATQAESILKRIDPKGQWQARVKAKMEAKKASSQPTAKSTYTPDTMAGRFADKRLVMSDAEYKAEFDSLPTRANVPVASSGYVQVGLNGKPLTLKFGRSWESIVTVKDLERVGLKPPDRVPDEIKRVPNSNIDNKIWKTAYTVDLAGMKRKIPFTIVTNPQGFPTLGHAFFEDLKFTPGGPGFMVLNKEKGASVKGKQATIADYKSEYASLPDKAEFRYTPGEQGHMIVTAYVNNRPIQCMFDTGASGFFGVTHCASVGINPPRPTDKADGVTRGWAGKSVPVYNRTAKVRIGNLTRTLPVRVSPMWNEMPLLGQEFLRDYRYSIDQAGKRVELWKKTAATAETKRSFNRLYDIPCKVENDREYVSVKIGEGVVSDVLIDTGASNTIVSMEDARSLGLSIDPNGPYSTFSGVGGGVKMYPVFADIELGPIKKSGFRVLVGGHAGSAIGQDFMSGWRFTVDREAKLLRFFH